MTYTNTRMKNNKLGLDKAICTLLDDMFLGLGTRGTKERQFKEAYVAFSDLRAQIELEIAEGFERGLKKFSGMDTDYYCRIRPTPEVTNTHLN